MTETLVCAHCGRNFQKDVSQANRQRRVVGEGVRFFCTRECHHESRRMHKPKAQRVAEKAAYDRAYRAKNRDALKAKKRAYHQRTYDPDAAREYRARVRDRHRAYWAEYSARPEWKKHKIEYDRRWRARAYGAFKDCHVLLVALEKEIRRQPWYERAKERGYYDNLRTTQQRKRNDQISRW